MFSTLALTFCALSWRSQGATIQDESTTYAFISDAQNVLQAASDQLHCTAPARYSLQVWRQENFFVTNIGVGTPAQDMPCLLDIGWNDLFVPSVNCTSSDCYGRPKYVASASSSHSSNKTSVSIFYWVEQTWGLRTLDSLHLGELTIPNYVFEEASEVEGWLWPEDSAPIGVLGLARLPYHIRWSNLSSHNSFQRMLTDDLLGCAIFSLKLPQSHSDIGELLFGAVNDTYFRGRVSILDVTGHLIDPRLEWFSGGWQVQGHSARFGRHVFEDLSNKTAIFTSVFPEVGMPGRMLHHVEAALHPDTLGDVHCSKRLILPDFIITLGTGSRISSFVLSPWDYIRSSSKAIKGCSTIFVPSDEEKEEDYFLIGNLFLDRYYHIFDAENMTVAIAETT